MTRDFFSNFLQCVKRLTFSSLETSNSFAKALNSKCSLNLWHIPQDSIGIYDQTNLESISYSIVMQASMLKTKINFGVEKD